MDDGYPTIAFDSERTADRRPRLSGIDGILEWRGRPSAPSKQRSRRIEMRVLFAIPIVAAMVMG
ncbi:MAG: hypothetical protein ACREB6_13165, partial [Rhodospirillales bacterium]